MLLAMLLIVVLLLGIAAAVVASTALSFTRMRHSWVVLVCALPAFAVGTFYTGGLLLARRHFSPWFVLFWVLLFLSVLSIARWLYNKP